MFSQEFCFWTSATPNRLLEVLQSLELLTKCLQASVEMLFPLLIDPHHSNTYRCDHRTRAVHDSWFAGRLSVLLVCFLHLSV